MNKKLSLIILVVVLVGVASLFLFLEPDSGEEVITENTNVEEAEENTSEEIDTSDWQTYLNENMGFEIKIPENWFCDRPALYDDTSKGVVCLDNNDRNRYYEGELSKLSVIMFSKNFHDSNNDLSFYVEESVNKENLVKSYIINIDGVEGLLEDFGIQGNCLFIKDDYRWNISNQVQGNDLDKDIYKEIIGTFKFLN